MADAANGTQQSDQSGKSQSDKGSNNGSSSSSDDFRTKFEHADQMMKNWMAKATDFEKQLDQFKGLNIDKLKADSAELQRRLEGSDKSDDVEAAKKRLEDTYKSQIDGLKDNTTKLQSQIKTLRVTNEAMKLHSKFFVDGSEAIVQDFVNKFCDWDEKSGAIVIKQASGDVRYSPTRTGATMNVEELFTELQTQFPFLAKAKNNNGTMGSGDNRSTNANGGGSVSLPANVGRDVKEVSAHFKNNPDALKAFMNGQLKI